MPAIALVAAGGRLGLSLGRIFGGHGFDVALIARSAERLDELTGKLAAEGITAAGFPADVTDRPALAAALDNAAERFGRIDVLHYSSPGAGSTETLRSTGPLDVTVDNLVPQLECTCYGAVTATRAVLPAMLAAGAGTLLGPAHQPRARRARHLRRVIPATTHARPRALQYKATRMRTRACCSAPLRLSVRSATARPSCAE